MKSWQIARRLLYQNRWLYLLLVIWPIAMAALLLLPGGIPDPGDVLTILHQEVLYGFALVAFTGSVQLGNEQRSRRIVTVLSRAVSRRNYLLGLLWVAWIPLALYTVSFLVSGLLLSAQSHVPRGVFFAMALSLLFLGLWVATASLFFATWLFSWLASMCTLALVAAVAWLGQMAPGFGLGRLLFTLTQAGFSREAAMLEHPGDFAAAIVAAAVFFFAAGAIFENRDLTLTTD